MSGPATPLLEQALVLPEGDRRWLVEQLDASLGAAPAGGEEEDYWAEVARRSDEARAHPDRLIPWAEARENIRAELDRRRAARTRGEAP